MTAGGELQNDWPEFWFARWCLQRRQKVGRDDKIFPAIGAHSLTANGLKNSFDSSDGERYI